MDAKIYDEKGNYLRTEKNYKKPEYNSKQTKVKEIYPRDDGRRYKIIRFRQHGENKVVMRGLTLQEAQAHCSSEKTHGEGWFDGYTEEK